MFRSPELPRKARRIRPSRPPEILESRRLLASAYIGPATVFESSAPTEAVFTAALLAPSSTPVTLAYATVSGTAKAGVDFASTQGTIPAGQTSTTFSVALPGTDVSSSPNKIFSVALRALTAGDTVNARAHATIVDANPQPTVTIGDQVVVDTSSSGTTRSSTVVTLSNPSAKAVRLLYATDDGTAVSAGTGQQYRAARGVITFRPGQTSAAIPLRIVDNPAGEDTYFTLAELRTINATPSAVSAAATVGRVVIRDEVTAGLERPTLSVSSPTVLAGDSATFTVSLSSAATHDVTLRYATIAGAAGSGDVTPVNGFLTIPAGQTSASFTVTTTADASLTEPETFPVRISAVANADPTSLVATGTITPATSTVSPSVSVAGTTVDLTPGEAGTADFTVTLSAASTEPVTVSYATADGTAVAGTDYTATSGTLTFAPGVTSLTVPVAVIGQSSPGTSAKTFSLVLTGATGATLGTSSAVATLQLSSAPPSSGPALTVAGGTVSVGTSGTATLAFTVSLSQAVTSTVTVDYATLDGSAVAGTDYTAASGTLTFAPGVTSQTVDVTVYGESTTAASKTLSLLISDATGAQITSSSAVGTITYGSSATTPAVAVAPAATSVGTSGTSTLDFVVTLSAPSTSVVTVSYATADGTAVAGTDYTATSGTLSFPAGTITQTVPVTVAGETTSATTKTLTLNLSDPTNATLGTASATGTITYVPAGSSVVLSDKLSNTSDGTEEATGSTYLAASFTTGSTAATLDVVTLLLAQATAGSAQVAIYTDGGLQPGTLVATLASPLTIASALAETTFTPSGTVALTADTTYWVVLTAPSGAYDWSWTSDDTGNGDGFTDTWAQSLDAGASWFAFDSSPTQFSITATASS